MSALLMNILFIHQNMPGQFGALAAALSSDPGHRVVFLTERNDRQIPGVERVVYKAEIPRSPTVHRYGQTFERSLVYGQAVARACVKLADDGFRPDVVIGHPGWGETLFVKDLFPHTPLILYAEHFEQADRRHRDQATGVLDRRAMTRAAMAHMLVSLDACNLAWSPLAWQKSTFPAAYQDRIQVLHDGVQTQTAKPDPGAMLRVREDLVLSARDEVITYCARGLEPCRGFDKLMYALPEILAARPAARVVIAGEDVSYYGAGPEEGSWRQKFAADVHYDPDRVIFTGRLPAADYIRLLQISSLHLYLSEPFVLSWSFMDAMSTGCCVLAASNAPVREILVDGENGFLTDRLCPAGLARAVAAALEHPDLPSIRANARRTIVQAHDLSDCVRRRIASIDALVGGVRPKAGAGGG
jgi:glycosyltransferase involved in cell wall biosynthesis